MSWDRTSLGIMPRSEPGTPLAAIVDSSLRCVVGVVCCVCVCVCVCVCLCVCELYFFEALYNLKYEIVKALESI